LRLSFHSTPLDALRVCAAALTCGAELEISWTPGESKNGSFNWLDLIPILRVVKESEQAFFKRVEERAMGRVRLVEPASSALQLAASQSAVHIIDAPVLANGRLELLHYLREIALSIDYHRYGNLGLREGELRKHIL
jgi:RHH-type proline utilization regulon transcriptional repressor/proline dehydrogenase/delta 1-pyrroline-5-carboxylate dehydrogenase